MSTASVLPFPDECRKWRQLRKLSQLELALNAEVSQRHLSYLETGRSQPSREMVIRLAEAMDIPLRERNLLLQSAGYVAGYSESDLEAPGMAPIKAALERMLAHHDPLPAVVVDRAWNVLKSNRSANALFALSEKQRRAVFGDSETLNLALLTLHPDGLRGNIRNWEQAAPAFIQRLRREALAAGDAELQAKFDRFIAQIGEVDLSKPVSEALLPVLPLELSFGDTHLSLFSVISTFGTPQDVTTDEVRIEMFYPADEQTTAFFEASSN